MSSTVETASDIRPYQIDIPDQALDDLRRRIAATNWPERETVASMRLRSSVSASSGTSTRNGRMALPVSSATAVMTAPAPLCSRWSCSCARRVSRR